VLALIAIGRRWYQNFNLKKHAFGFNVSSFVIFKNDVTMKTDIVEICADNIDNDCDGQTDEGCVIIE
jgi:hypothetical protein